MKKIYLFCSAGMSTSMLAQEMQNVADACSRPSLRSKGIFSF